MKDKKREGNEILFYVIASFFVIALFWSSYAEVEQVIRIEAKVEPAKKVQTVKTRYAGTIESISYEVGDKVRKGEILLNLNDEEYKVSYDASYERVNILKDEYALIEPLVKKGIESKITLINLRKEISAEREKYSINKLLIAGSEIKSPITGIITAVLISGEGEVIERGQSLIEVVPESEYFVVKGKVRPQDVSKIKIGQKARVSFTAYDYSIYGVMKGEVVKIAQNTTEARGEESYYDTWIRTTENSFENSEVIPKILPGMISEVNLVGDKKTVLEYLINPLNKISTRALTEWSN
jgi:adhesin transport system membrane fusion protein